jgi:hypothetical protein
VVDPERPVGSGLTESAHVVVVTMENHFYGMTTSARSRIGETASLSGPIVRRSTPPTTKTPKPLLAGAI